MRHCNNISFLTSTVRLFLFKIVPSREVFLDLQGSKEISRVNKRNATVRFSLVGFIDSWWRTVVKPGFQRIWKAIKRCWFRAFSVDPKHHRQLNPFSLAIAIMPRLFDSILERLRFTFTAYGKWQTANVSWEFLRIENKQIKTVQSDSYG